MELHLSLCLVMVLLFCEVKVAAEGDVIQENASKLSPDRRAAVEERCNRIRRDCIASGDLFKRSVVCAGSGKRFINECALQIRSCDLLLDTGEEIMQERCVWVVKPEPESTPEAKPKPKPTPKPKPKPVTNAPTTVNHQSPWPPLDTTRPIIIVDYFSPTESTQVTSEKPSTEGPTTTRNKPTTIHWDFFRSTTGESTRMTTGKPSTERFETTRNEQTTKATSTSSFIDHGNYMSSYWYEYSSETGGGFVPPDDLGSRSCCRGDTPCASCIRQDRGGEVCGSDGNTYDTECDLDNHACDTGNEHLVVQHLGSCQPGGGNDNRPQPPRGDLGKR